MPPVTESNYLSHSQRVKNIRNIYDPRFHIHADKKPKHLTKPFQTLSELQVLFKGEPELYKFLISEFKDFDDVRAYSKHDIREKLVHAVSHKKINLAGAQLEGIADRFITLIYSAGGWFYEDHEDNPGKNHKAHTFIHGQINMFKLWMAKTSKVPVIEFLSDLIKIRVEENKSYDKRYGIDVEGAYPHLHEDLKAYINEKGFLYKALDAIGVKCLNDFRKFTLANLKAIRIDGKPGGERLFNDEFMRKIEIELIRKFHGFLFDEQNNDQLVRNSLEQKDIAAERPESKTKTSITEEETMSIKEEIRYRWNTLDHQDTYYGVGQLSKLRKRLQNADISEIFPEGTTAHAIMIANGITSVDHARLLEKADLGRLTIDGSDSAKNKDKIVDKNEIEKITEALEANIILLDKYLVKNVTNHQKIEAQRTENRTWVKENMAKADDGTLTFVKYASEEQAPPAEENNNDIKEEKPSGNEENNPEESHESQEIKNQSGVEIKNYDLIKAATDAAWKVIFDDLATENELSIDELESKIGLKKKALSNRTYYRNPAFPKLEYAVAAYHKFGKDLNELAPHFQHDDNTARLQEIINDPAKLQQALDSCIIVKKEKSRPEPSVTSGVTRITSSPNRTTPDPKDTDMFDLKDTDNPEARATWEFAANIAKEKNIKTIKALSAAVQTNGGTFSKNGVRDADGNLKFLPVSKAIKLANFGGKDLKELLDLYKKPEDIEKINKALGKPTGSDPSSNDNNNLSGKKNDNDQHITPESEEIEIIIDDKDPQIMLKAGEILSENMRDVCVTPIIKLPKDNIIRVLTEGKVTLLGQAALSDPHEFTNNEEDITLFTQAMAEKNLPTNVLATAKSQIIEDKRKQILEERALAAQQIKEEQESFVAAMGWKLQ